MINPLSLQNGIIMYSNRSNNNNRQPVCCAVIPSKFGVPLVLTCWISLSLYFASLAFMGRNPFYSYFVNATNLVFGVLNIIFVVVCLFGYSLHLIKRTLGRYRQYAKLQACCVAAILIDMFINFVVFCVKKNEFQARCQDTARNNLNQYFQNKDLLDSSIPESTIAFNCSRLFTVEAEFSFAVLVLMIMVYSYWSSFMIEVSMNFVLMRPLIQIHQNRRQHMSGLVPNFQPPTLPIMTTGNVVPPVAQESPKMAALSNVAPSSLKKHNNIVLL